VVLFLPDCSWMAPLPLRLDQLCVLPPTPPGRGELLWPPVLSSGVQSAHQLHWTMWFPQEQVMVSCSPGRVADSLGWNWVSSGMILAGRSLCLCNMAGPECSGCWLNSFYSSLHCIFAFPQQDKGSKGKKGVEEWLSSACARISLAVSCYKKLF
jgi:hypothetical protein